MSIIALGSRLLRRRTNIICIRSVQQEPPRLKFKDRITLIGDPDISNEDYEEYYEERGTSLKYLLLSMPIMCFFLGTWQIQRRQWKLELIEELKKKTTVKPLALPEDLKDLEKMEYYPITVRGEYLYENEFTIGPKSLIKDGAGGSEKGGGIMSSSVKTGYNLVTPFKVENRDTTILVNRGWIPNKTSHLPKEKLGHVTGTVEITGIVRLNETRQPFMPKNTPTAGVYVYRDVDAMAYLAKTDPVYIELIESSGVPDGPIAGQTRISLRNEHSGYIVTWYGLGLITAWMWRRMYIKKLPLL